MSVLYVWDSDNLKYKEVPYPIVRQNNKYYNSIGYRYTTKSGRYIRIWGASNYKAATPSIVSFTNGSWEDICAMLESHYLGFINVSAYWKVGDTRTFHLNAIPATSTMAEQPEQDVTMTIVDFNKDALTSPGTFRKTAAVSLIADKMLSYEAITNTSEIAIPWTSWTRRTWMNNDLLNAMDDSISSKIQSVTKNTYRVKSDKVISVTNDKIWMPSATEMANAYPVEGIYYSYYSTNGAAGRTDEILANTAKTEYQYLDANMATDYFSISGSLAYNASWNGWISTNHNNSTSSGSTFTAKQACQVVIEWSVSSERSFDKIWLDCKGSRYVNGVSGDYSGSFNVSLSAGDTISMSYSKDGSVSNGSDLACIKIKPIKVNTYYPTRTIWDTALLCIDGKTGKYIGTNGTRIAQATTSPIKVGFCL